MKWTEFPEKLINVFTTATIMKKEDSFPETTTVADEKLIELFITTNDEGAFEEIVNRYGDKIYGLAFRITRDHHSAEEILQEVFLTIINKVDTFRGDARFSTWLYRVALNASYMRLREEI